MCDLDHINLQYVTWLCTFDENRSGERMNARAVNAGILRHGHARPHLSAAGIEAFQMHGVAACDAESRW
jgi:hypothetical protein